MGKHNITVSVNGNDNYTRVNPKTFENTLTVVQATIAIETIDEITLKYGENNTITVTGKITSNIQFGYNYTGNIALKILDYANTSTVNNDGTYTITVNLSEKYISSGSYDINITCGGNKNYKAESKTFKNNLTVEKGTAEIESLEKITIAYGQNNTIIVTGKIKAPKYGSNYTGTVTATINKLTGSADVVNGTFNVEITGLELLAPGEYTIKVNGSETENYTSLSENTVLTITKAQFNIDATVTGVSEGPVKMGQKSTVTIDISNIPASTFNTTGEIVINVTGIEKNYTLKVPVENNTIQLDIIANPGTYTLNAQYTGNKNYNATAIVTKTFTVTKWNETDLQALIGNSIGNVTLEHDYEFTNENATVNVTDSVTINGNNHTIDANGSSTAFNITADNVTMDNVTINNVNGTAIATNGTNTTISNVEINNINGTAIQLNTDNSTVTNITVTNITGTLINVNGDNNTISNINATGNATIKVDGKGNIIENVTGATVIPKITATNVVKGNDVFITATVSAPEGNITVQFQGKKYTVPLTDGKAVITIPNIGSGTYNNVEVNYQGTGLYQNVSTKTSFTSKVAITGNKNVATDYLSGYKYTVRIMDASGNYASGVTVKMTINGKTYNVKTDKNGYAKLTIKFKPKTYTITVQYMNIKKTNKIKVKSTIKLVKKTVKVKKTAKKLVLKAKLKWSNGKAIRGKVVKFKFKGKTYKAKTNKKGIAKIKIKKKVIKKLKAGKKYKFKAKYGKEYVKGKVKVKN